MQQRFHSSTIRSSPVLWITGIVLVFLLVTSFSTRLLSDPDLGFHLHAGQWILDHRSIPEHDISTYTVPHNSYVDLHWLFQVFIYSIFILTGYNGLSILVTILVVCLFLLIWYLLSRRKVSGILTVFLLALAAFTMEQRFILRPELFTYIFLACTLIVLEGYRRDRKGRLFLLPLIMVVWCNTEGLFMLAFGLMGAYYAGDWVQQKRPDWQFAGWILLSVICCLINPYGLQGFLFPFELLTRFQPGNVFQQHIKEFCPLFALPRWTPREYLFLGYFLLTLTGLVFTYKKHGVQDWILTFLFGILAFLAIRNIPLFILVTLPITGQSWNEITRKLRQSQVGIRFTIVPRVLTVLFLAGIAGLLPRIWTNAYYAATSSYNKTGIGPDSWQQPEPVANFMIRNKLEGRIINSLSYGSWFSWRLPQPVFIDAQLEVIGEALYEEVVQSWDGQLNRLIGRYDPQIIVYDYERYFTWTPQLLQLPDWQLVYLDGQSAVFAKASYLQALEYSPGIPATPEFPEYPVTPAEKISILQQSHHSKWYTLTSGFYRKSIPTAQRMQNMGSFYLQAGEFDKAETCLLAALETSSFSRQSVWYALADIYLRRGDEASLEKCYTTILSFDPENQVVAKALQQVTGIRKKYIPDLSRCLDERAATIHYHNGMARYKAGDVYGALAEFDSAILVFPGFSKAYNDKATIEAISLGDYHKAMEDFSRAIACDPSCAEAYLGRGSCRLNLNDRIGAREDWQKAKELGNRQAADLLSGDIP